MPVGLTMVYLSPRAARPLTTLSARTLDLPYSNCGLSGVFSSPSGFLTGPITSLLQYTKRVTPLSSAASASHCVPFTFTSS